MTAAEFRQIVLMREALSGLPASNAATVNQIPFIGGDKMGYDCGIPQYPYASELPDEEHPSRTGKRVLLGDINKIIQLVSTGLYLKKLGASNEFDERVVEIDRGAKVESDDYGYPNGAVIDWWNEGTFKKAICIKSGTGVENGNCKVGPDDPVHGVNGTGTKYWQAVDFEEPKRYEFVTTDWADEEAILGGVFQTYCIVGLGWAFIQENNHGQNNTTTNGYIFAEIRAKKGDTISFSSDSVTLNGNTFSISNSDVINIPAYNYIKHMSINTRTIRKLVEAS